MHHLNGLARLARLSTTHRACDVMLALERDHTIRIWGGRVRCVELARCPMNIGVAEFAVLSRSPADHFLGFRAHRLILLCSISGWKEYT